MDIPSTRHVATFDPNVKTAGMFVPGIYMHRSISGRSGKGSIWCMLQYDDDAPFVSPTNKGKMATIIKEGQVTMDGYPTSNAVLRDMMTTKYMRVTGIVEPGDLGTVVMNEVVVECVRPQTT